ncbi:hypothetical protein BCR44DRAFT_1437265 [Catenaria anguillulae PL171]|uniref:Uncharacterized protein n=1 Tax=Catenaria anguillulae PL171 TaxID=765915 RepID=A0A1Y2HH56_9FUNG|nr:hypothetical protein BCR44DRAFT_1437265 [Catenaria anguillulae PL171]
MSRIIARVVVPSVTLVLSALVLAFASQYRAERIAANEFLRGGVNESELDMLYHALQSPDAKLKKKAIEAATQLALSGPFFEYLLELARGSPTVDGNESEQLMAVTAIAFFAREESNRARLIDNDAFDVFTTLLRQSTNPAIREHAAAGLMRLIRGDNERAVMLATCDVFPALLDVLRNSTSEANRLVHFVLGILHAMSKVAELIETLQAFNVHVVVCQFWRKYTTYKDFASLSALIIQNMLEQTKMERAAAILTDLGPHGFVPLSTSLLLSDNSQSQALTFIFYCAKNNLFIDQFVKRPYLVSTILTLIPSDGYSKALVAIVCLDVLCGASATVTKELVDSNVISVIQPCLTRGTTLLKLAAFKLVTKVLAGGTPIDKVLDSPNVLEHIVKLALTEPVAAELLWKCIEMDFDRRTLPLADGKPVDSIKWNDSVLAGDKVQDVVVKMINATDADIATVGLRAAALTLFPRRIHVLASGLLSHGLFDSLRKCLLQSSTLALVETSVRMLQVLLSYKDVTVEVVHLSIAQVLVHNLLVRIPEVRDMLIKLRKSAALLTKAKDPSDEKKVTPKIDPVLLLSFETTQIKLASLLVVMVACLSNPDVYALLKARQLFELKTIAQQAVWFVASFHNDHEDRCHVPMDCKELVARVQKLQKGAAAKSSPLMPHKFGDKSKGEEYTKFEGLWTMIVLMMSRLGSVLFTHDDLFQVLIRREFLAHLYLSFITTGSPFVSEIFCVLAAKLPAAELWRDYHEAIRYLFFSRMALRDPTRAQSMDTLLHLVIVPATGPARSLMYDQTRMVSLLPFPVVANAGDNAPHLQGGIHSASIYADRMGAFSEIPTVSTAHVIASFGVRGSTGGKWGFSVRLNDEVSMPARVGFICGEATTKRFGEGALIGDEPNGFSVNFVDGFKCNGRMEPFVFQGSTFYHGLSICVAGNTLESASVVFDDLPDLKSSSKVWFPILTTTALGLNVDFDPPTLPSGYLSFESARRRNLLVPIRAFTSSTAAPHAASESMPYSDLPTYTVPPPLPPSPSKPGTTFSMDSSSAATALETSFAGHLYYEIEADWPLPSAMGGPGVCTLGWRIAGDKYLVWHVLPYAGIEAILMVPDLATLATLGQEQVHEWASRRARNELVASDADADGAGAGVYVVMAQDLPSTVGATVAGSVFAKRTRVGIGYDRARNAVVIARPFVQPSGEPRLAIAGSDWYEIEEHATSPPSKCAVPVSVAPMPLIDGWVHPR